MPLAFPELESTLAAATNITQQIHCPLIADIENPISTFGGEKLSSYWAQEYVGADLIWQEFEDRGGLSGYGRAQVSVIDSEFQLGSVDLDNLKFSRNYLYYNRANESHGTAVTNLIHSTNHLSVSPLTEIVSLHSGWWDVDLLKAADEIWVKTKRSTRRDQYVALR